MDMPCEVRPFKTVLLFGSKDQKRKGGMFDFVGSFDTAEEAEQCAEFHNLVWWHTCHPATGHFGCPDDKI